MPDIPQACAPRGRRALPADVRHGRRRSSARHRALRDQRGGRPRRGDREVRRVARIPASIRRLDIPASVFRQTLDRLSGSGRAASESLAYWSGTIRRGRVGAVRSAIFADEYDGFASSPGHASVTLGAALRIGAEVHRRGEVLFAQIHTHPREAFHSRIDDARPISHRLGFFSLVIPRFGAGVDSIAQCRAYEHRGGGAWKGLRPRTAAARLRIAGGEAAGE